MSSLGSGATFPYLFLYLQQGRGFSSTVVGLLLTTRAVGTFLGSWVGGRMVDRCGVRRVTLLSLTTAAASTLTLLAVSDAATGVVVLMFYGLTSAALGTALNTLLGTVASPSERPRVYSLRYVLGNVGGIGGAVLASLMLTVFPVHGYSVLYMVDAASFGALAVIVWRYKESGPATDKELHTPQVGRSLLGDKPMRWLCFSLFFVVAAGYCQLGVAVPSFMSEEGLPDSLIGWTVAANMITVILVQTPARKISSRFRRTTVMFWGIAAMLATWLLMCVVPAAGTSALLVACCIFGIGEILLAPLMVALVNDMASAGTHGRYNGAYSTVWNAGWIAGTGGTGLLLAICAPRSIMLVLVCGLALAALAVRQMRNHLAPSLDRPAPLDSSNAPSVAEPGRRDA
ncbi:MFS transporter [Streptomyces sp. NPDC085614]|uniref:MFS transporter n=1 Tax=Streptomyces sp. NPDC085614 TaxID=3365733 RepID=UPI0037D397CD